MKNTSAPRPVDPTTPRVGLGYDIHRLDPEAPGEVLLGGVAVPCPGAVVAHSDGDVLLHAVGDALLGAMGAGDLGEHFPDDDPSQSGRPSTGIVREILALPVFAGWRVAQVDVNLIAQTPRLAPFREPIRRRLGELLGLPADRIGVKARTKEGCDAAGRGEAIEAQALVMLVPE